MNLLDIQCTCGRANPGASGEVKEQIFKNVVNCFYVLTASAFVIEKQERPVGKQLVSPKGSQLYHKAREHLKRIKKKGKTSLLVRYLEAEAYRVHFQLGGMTKGNGKHIGTVLRADQEDNTTPVRQTREQWNCK